MAQLEAEGVTVRFQGLCALEAVGLSLGEGDVLGLLGPNGAGKTTLVNVMSGFQRPSSGTVTLDGARVDDLAPETLARRGVARTFQSVRLFARLTVLENVEVAALANARRSAAAREAARAA